MSALDRLFLVFENVLHLYFHVHFLHGGEIAHAQGFITMAHSFITCGGGGTMLPSNRILHCIEVLHGPLHLLDHRALCQWTKPH
jgi:hypothetical protein